MPIDTLNVLCAQLTRDLFAIAKFLFILISPLQNKGFLGNFVSISHTINGHVRFVT